MKITIDTDLRELSVSDDKSARKLPLHSTEAFEILSHLSTNVGRGREVLLFLFLARPAHHPAAGGPGSRAGGHLGTAAGCDCRNGRRARRALILYASICKSMGKGRVVGIDIDIRQQNRAAIESHPLADLISLIVGSSTEPSIVAAAASKIRPDDTVLVLLDSNHSYDHVKAELDAYAPLVSVGSYLSRPTASCRSSATRPAAPWLGE